MKANFIPLVAIISLAACNSKEAHLTFKDAEAPDGAEVSLISFETLQVIETDTISGGEARFNINFANLETPMLTQVLVDGHPAAYYILEQGDAAIEKSNVATGTPSNDRFHNLMIAADSLKHLDDLSEYTEKVGQLYDQGKENAEAPYFALEWIKYADPMKVDSLVRAGADDIIGSPITSKYIRLADRRAKTGPGHTYVDFTGESMTGNPMNLSALMKPDMYNLIYVWASWCPDCEHQTEKLQELYEKYREQGLNIIGVTIADQTPNSKEYIIRHSMTWPVLFNTSAKPSDIYGFSGVPYLILVGPDGYIINRTESFEKMERHVARFLD